MIDKTPWDRLREQFKPDGKGRFKTADAMKVAIQIDDERRLLVKEIQAYKSHLRAVTAKK
jgi:hypothetical protein